MMNEARKCLLNFKMSLFDRYAMCGNRINYSGNSDVSIATSTEP